MKMLGPPPIVGADGLEIFWNTKPLDWLKWTLNFRISVCNWNKPYMKKIPTTVQRL